MNTRPIKTTCLLICGFLVAFHLRVASTQTDLCECPESNEYNIIQIKNVLENAPPNSVIKSLNFKGGSMVEVTADIKTPFVSFDEATHELKVAQGFQVLKHNPLFLDLRLTCKILRTKQKIEYQVVIEVKDTNNHPPTFADSPYTFNISELTPAGLALTPLIQGIDLDPMDTGQLTYSIWPSSPFSDYFNFTIPSKGQLYLQHKLDYQSVKTIVLNIQVKDNSYNTSVSGIYQPQHTTETTATINVIPIYADIPSFVKHSYIIDLDENFDPSKSIEVDSSWQSHAANGYIISIVEDINNDDWKSFAIEQKRGSLRAVESLTKGQYLLQLQVKRSSQSLFATTLVVVRKVPKRIFLHHQYNVTLPPSIRSNSLIQRLSTSATCSYADYNFQIEQEDQFSSLFKVTKEGLVLSTRDLNLRNGQRFRLKLLMFQGSVKRDETFLNVHISNAPPRAFTFSKDIYQFDFYNNTYIGKVNVVGLSSLQGRNNEIVYHLISQQKNLEINSKGEIWCRREGCWSSGQPILVTARLNNSVSASAMVLLKTQQSPFEQTSSINYKAAFIVTMLFLCFLLLFIIAAALLMCFLYKRKSKNFEEHFNNISSSFSEESGDPFTQNKKLSKLDKLQGILGNDTTDMNNQAFQGTSQNKQEKELFPQHTVKVSQNPAAVEAKNPQASKDLTNSNDSSLLARSDLNTSQDTINASIMTLTRPAVGTNGITVYY